MAVNNEFQVVTLQYSKDSTSHQLFVKENRIRGTSLQKSLFVANLPPYIDGHVLKNTYSNSVSSIELIQNQKEGIGFKNAMLNCKSNSKVFDSSVFQCEAPVTGLKKWINEYNNSRPEINDLEKQVNRYALEFKKQEEKKNKNTDNKDEDSWTIVKKKGSKNSDVLQKIQKTKMKKKDTQNFYVFQIRENNLKKLTDLRKNYDEAKKRVNLIKNTRKFKPF